MKSAFIHVPLPESPLALAFLLLSLMRLRSEKTFFEDGDYSLLWAGTIYLSLEKKLTDRSASVFP